MVFDDDSFRIDLTLKLQHVIKMCVENFFYKYLMWTEIGFHFGCNVYAKTRLYCTHKCNESLFGFVLFKTGTVY